MSDDQSLTAKVLKNSVLIEKILNELDGGLMRNLNARLISKEFNEICIKKIHSAHEKLKLECFAAEFLNIARVYVYINHDKIHVNHVGGYLRFLRMINTKVEEIHLKSLWRLDVLCRLILHDSITRTLVAGKYEQVKSLTGMSDLCRCCDNCSAIIGYCEEYGPVEGDELPRSMTIIKYYDKLSIRHSNLVYAAYRIRDRPSSVRCNTLQVRIPEGPLPERSRFETNPDSSVILFPPLPRRPFHQLINLIGIEIISFKFEKRISYYSPNTSNVFRFNDPFESVKILKKRPRIEKVVVHLKDSENCSKGITENSKELDSYKNLVANIRRVFSTGHISFVFSHWSHLSDYKIDLVLRNLLRTIFKEDQTNLKVDIFYYAKMEQFEYLDNSDMMHLTEVAWPIRYKNHQFRLSEVGKAERMKYSLKEDEFINEKWIGRRFELKDPSNNCIINWEVLVRENEMARVTKELIRNHPNALIRYFFD